MPSDRHHISTVHSAKFVLYTPDSTDWVLRPGEQQHCVPEPRVLSGLPGTRHIGDIWALFLAANALDGPVEMGRGRNGKSALKPRSVHFNLHSIPASVNRVQGILFSSGQTKYLVLDSR